MWSSYPERIDRNARATCFRGPLTKPGATGERAGMRRPPHENVATVLVDPAVLAELEVHLMGLDLHLWPVATAPICADGPRMAFQVRRRLVMSRQGAWDDAAAWVPAWISFGDTWYVGAEPLPWSAHQTLYRTLEQYAGRVRYRRGLGGVPRLDVPRERSA